MDILADYICIPRLLNEYPNVVPIESSKSIEDKVYTNELDTLDDPEVRDLIVGPNAPLYDGTKSIKQANMSPFFKIINLIITNNIDHHQHKMKGGMNWVKFMI